jgi:hypothetical protein
LCSQLANSEQSSRVGASRTRSSTIEEDLKELKLRNSGAKTKQQENLDFDSALEQITHLKAYIESTARDLNINFNFNGEKLDFFFKEVNTIFEFSLKFKKSGYRTAQPAV